MKNIQKQFKDFCGKKYARFMEKLYANEKGEIELKYWQEKLIEEFFSTHPDIEEGQKELLEEIRDGTEMMYKCPIPICCGDVCCINRKKDVWACGECGEAWRTRQSLFNFINVANDNVN